MMNSPRPDDLSFLIAKLHPQAARYHKEELIFFIMAVPDELALELDQFDLHIVDVACNSWRPGFLKRGKPVPRDFSW